jgi:hypothetical protein
VQLKRADKLAWSALKPAVDDPNLNLHKDTTVMTYFQKGAFIRVIPYAPVALLAIPFTATEVPRDFLALPHEVGHYVYRNARIDEDQAIPQVLGKNRIDEDQTIPQVLGKKLIELAEPSPRWARRWKEEIFADVYGCLIGGPVTGLSFQDLSLQSSRTPVVLTPGEYPYGKFTEDDGVHPASVARPYVYTRVLGLIGFGKSARLLNEAWEALSPVKETPTFSTRYSDTGGRENIDVQLAKDEAYKIIDAIFKLLPTKDLSKSSWSTDPNNGLRPELYQKFEETGINNVINNPNLPNPPKIQCNSWKAWIKNEKFFPGIDDAPPTKDKTPIDPGKADRLEHLEQEPRHTWNHVFLASGWATKLPGASGGNGILYPKNWQSANQAGGGGGSGY